MPFNSIVFVVFFVLVYVVYRLLPHRAQNVFLLLASYVFFGWWDVRFLFLIAVSTSLDFICGLLIADGQLQRRARVGVSTWVVVGAVAFLVVGWDAPRDGGFPLAPLRLGSLDWNYRWLLPAVVVLATVAFNLFYPALARLEDQKRRKLCLLASLTGNLSILGFFKYFNFFLENLEALSRGIGLEPGRLHLDVVLPAGLSFYTFMTLSYTIDVYKGRIAPARVFHEYALFVAFFPKLLAGPIERATSFLPQIAARRTAHPDDVMHGLQEIVYGLFKKIVIADGMASSVNSVFAGTYELSWADATIGTLLFTAQIYCDFSGYSDIATGTSRLLGFNLTKNFAFPYFSRNPSEFWGRWHISLSSWFRDYVFFPLGGPYGNALRWTRNIFVTFLATGLWHGAAWTFVVWGLYHGVLLWVHRIKEALRKSHRRSRHGLKNAASILAFFILTCLGWILFRSSSIGQAFGIFAVLIRDFGNLKLHAEIPTETAIVGIPVLIAMEFFGNKSKGMSPDVVLPMPAWTAAYASMVFLVLLSLSNVPAGFIYLVF